MTREARFPTTDFVAARHDKQKKRLPQCIAHRGYKASYPENSIEAFRAAIEVGAQAIETDVHLTKDDVVVLSHDATLKRCFGRPEKIIDHTWDELKDYKTTRAPHVPMPRLVDLLDVLSETENKDIWCLLDIKLDNDAENVMKLIASTIKSYSTTTTTTTMSSTGTGTGHSEWNKRIVLGCWAAKYLPLCLKYLPGFPVVHIGFSTTYARHFFDIENVGFNMLFPMLVAPGGRKFLHDAKAVYHRQVIAWTVNKKDGMRWCIRHGLDGVITDDPALFNQIRESPPDSWTAGLLPLSLRGLFDVLRLWITVIVMSVFYSKRFLPVASRELIEHSGDT